MGNISQENICGFSVDAISAEACVQDILDYVSDQKNADGCRWLACLNPHSYAESIIDRLFATALHGADWLIPDGSGVVLASSLLEGRIRERVTGSDIFQGVCDGLSEQGSGSVFFLGSTEETLSKIVDKFSNEYPELKIAGCYSPPFKPKYTEEELEDMVSAINSKSPDVLWVGMTAPKQEKWLYQQSPRLNVKFAAAIGAVFDFYTGNVKRSHPIFQRLHLEWLPRLVQQPKRLWRRMGISAPIFLWHVLRQKFSSTQKKYP